MPARPRVIISMNGGLIQDIFKSEPMDILVIDWDTEDCDPDDPGLEVFPTGDGKSEAAYIGIWDDGSSMDALAGTDCECAVVHFVEHEGWPEMAEAEELKPFTICLQQGGPIWDFYVHLLYDPTEYLAKCKAGRAQVVECGVITPIAKDAGGQHTVRLANAVGMAEACLRGVRKIIAGH